MRRNVAVPVAVACALLAALAVPAMIARIEAAGGLHAAVKGLTLSHAGVTRARLKALRAAPLPEEFFPRHPVHGQAAAAAWVPRAPGAPPPPPPPGTVSFQMPGEEWHLEMVLPSFVIEPRRVEPNMMCSWYGGNRQTGVQISVFLTRGEEKDPAAVRDFYWQRMRSSPLEVDDVAFREDGPLALLEYTVHEHAGRRADMRNIHAYLVRGDIWISVHLSKMGYADSDAPLFAEALAGIRIVEGRVPSRQEPLSPPRSNTLAPDCR